MLLCESFRIDQDGPPGTLMQGNGTSTLNGLPASNGDFGANSVTHNFQGAPLDVANIEIFYAAAVYTHPADGSVQWCDEANDSHLLSDDGQNGNGSATSNWFYYYSQAWTPPCTVAFTTSGEDSASYFDPNHPDHVHVNIDAHGTLGRNIYEPRQDPLLGAMRMQQVGSKTFYGIDAYASSITHEYGHMTAYNALQAGAIDTDGDRLPDSLEAAVGLNPNNPDTTGTTKGDNEVYCDIKQRNALGPREADWADNGLNHGTIPGPNPADRSPTTYWF